MKKVLLVSLLLSGLVLAAGQQIVATEVQPATRTVPVASDFTTAASLGLVNVSDFRVMICAVASNDAPQASGSLQAYLLDERTGQVARNKLLDLDLAQQAAPGAGKCLVFPDQQVGVAADRVMYAATTLLITDGGTLYTEPLSDGGTRLDGGAFNLYYRGWSVVR